MTDFEICQEYRQAKKKREQIRILADLNCCSTKDINEVLVANGEKTFNSPASPETMARLERERLERLESLDDRTESVEPAQIEDPVIETEQESESEESAEPAETVAAIPEVVAMMVADWLQENKAKYDEAVAVIRRYNEIQDWLFGGSVR